MRGVAQEALDDGINFASQNTFVRSGESGIGKVPGAVGKNLFVSRLDVGVRADDGTDPAIQHPAESDFFRGRFRVHVDEDHPAFPSQPRHFEVGAEKWVVEGRHECSALEIQNRKWSEAGEGDDGAAAAGGAMRIICRAKETGFIFEKGEDLFLIPEMIPAGDDIDARVEKLRGGAGSDARAAGGIFAIGDDAMNLVFGPEPGNQLFDRAPPGFTDHIAYEEQIHEADSRYWKTGGKQKANYRIAPFSICLSRGNDSILTG